MKYPRVTDHCLVRYLQRVKGLDVDEIRSHIAHLCQAAVNAGAHCVKAEGVNFEIQHGAVITYTPPQGVSRTKRAKFIERARV